MSDQAKPDDLAGQMLTGVVEALFAFGVMLTNRGYISRQDLADGFGFQLQQLRQRSAEVAKSQAEFTARTAPLVALAEAFSSRISTGPIVIQGGKVDPPEDSVG